MSAKTNSDILKELLAFNSSLTTEVNRLVDYIIENYLKPNGVKYLKIPSNNNEINNLFVAINSDLKNISQGLLLSGHLDVVPPPDKNTEAFIEKNGILYGRGTVDMKFFISTILFLIPFFKTLKYPIVFGLTADEETTFTGINALTDFFKQENIKPNYCIVGEPTNLQVVTVNQGAYEFESVFYGKSAHSSMPSLGSNAIKTAMEFISLLTKDVRLNDASKYKITHNIGIINGGVATNIIPDKCSLKYSFRFNNQEEESLIKEVVEKYTLIAKEISGYKVETTATANYKSFNNKNDEGFKQKILSIIEGKEVKSFTGTTEAGYWQNIGIDTIIYGAGQVSLAHTDNEFIDLEQLDEYALLIKKICKSLYN